MKTLTKEQASDLCDALDIYPDFFDENNEEYILLKEHNPSLLNAYETLFAIAQKDE